MPRSLRVVVAGGDAAARSLRTAGHEVVVLVDGCPADVLAEVCLQEDADAVVATGAATDEALASALAARGRDDVVRLDPAADVVAALAGGSGPASVDH